MLTKRPRQPWQAAMIPRQARGQEAMGLTPILFVSLPQFSVKYNHKHTSNPKWNKYAL